MTIIHEHRKLAAAIAVGSLLFTACGNDESSSGTSADGSTTEAEGSEATETMAETEGSGTTETMAETEGSGTTGTMAETGDTMAETATGSYECETALDEDNSVSAFSEIDLSGIEINVGSKDFPEQFVLGNLALVAFEAAGATVTDSTNLGGTVVNRDALLVGDIDAYWEYNGTGWTNHLALEDPSFVSEELTDAVCTKDLAENSIRWIGASEFNDTYGFATASDSPAAGGDLQAMMEYVNANPDSTVCMETEYPVRSDGLVLLEEATGLTIPTEQMETLESGIIYEETANGTCTFGEVFTTDGRIPALELDLVEDPGPIHIIYNASLTMSDDLYNQAPEAFEAIVDTILKDIDNETMAELNSQVSSDGADPHDVAVEYLTEKGLI